MPVARVTGANRGIGLEASRLLNKNGAQIIGISRSMPVEKNKDIFIEHYECDFSNCSNIYFLVIESKLLLYSFDI